MVCLFGGEVELDDDDDDDNNDDDKDDDDSSSYSANPADLVYICPSHVPL